MSRIGRNPVSIPNGAQVKLDGDRVIVQGPKGSLERRVPAGLSVELLDGGKQVLVKRSSDERRVRALHGLFRSLIANMVTGVTQGYSQKLQVVGVGYSAKVEGATLVLQVGFAHPVRVPIPDGLKIETPQQTTVAVQGVGPTAAFEFTVSGIDKELVGKFAAGLRRVRPPEPYKGKGIRYAEEQVRIKPGKAFVSGE